MAKEHGATLSRDEHPRKRSYATAALFIILAVMILGGCWMLARDGVQNEYVEGATRTPRPTIAVATDHVLYRDNTINEVLSSTITKTSPPDFSATQKALDADIAIHTAMVATQMEMVSSTREAEAIKQTQELYNIELTGAQAELNSKIQSLNYEEELHQEVYSHTLAMNAVELEQRERRLMLYHNLLMVGGGMMLFIGGTVAAIFIVVLGTYLYRRMKEEEPEPVMQRDVRLIVSAGKKTRFSDLPVDEARFRRWALNAVRGGGLSYDQWVSTTKVFTRPEYDKLLEMMRDAGILEYRDPDAPTQGQRVTRAGKAALAAYLRGE